MIKGSSPICAFTLLFGYIFGPGLLLALGGICCFNYYDYLGELSFASDFSNEKPLGYNNELDVSAVCPNKALMQSELNQKPNTSS